MNRKYFSIDSKSEGIYKEKGSKFIAFAFPVETEDEIKLQLDLLKKEYFDARHICYAYRLGENGEKFRANDDGEPNHTAGTPILNQLKSLDLSDVLVAVVRYFGGTKLGVSGLINAYKLSTQEALQQAVKVEKIPVTTITLSFEYQELNEAMKLIKKFECKIINQTYDNSKSSIDLQIPLEFTTLLENEIVQFSNLGSSLEIV